MSLSVKSLAAERALSRVPTEYRSFEAWPALEVTLLSPSNAVRHTNMARAIEMKLSGHSNADVAAAARVTIREFGRIFGRCLAQHRDGRIWGMRAVLKGARIRAPRRISPIRVNSDKPGAGFSGALGKVFADFPRIEEELVYELTVARREMPSVNRAGMRFCHRLFLKLCTKNGVKDTDYPFNTQHNGRRAFRLWMLNHFLPRHASAWIRAEQGASAAQAFDYQAGDGSSQSLAGCNEVWQIDEVCIDLEGRYELPNASGDWEQLELRRCSAIRLIETGATTTLAWRLVLAAQPTAEELLMVIWDAMNGPPKAPAVVPELDYMQGAGYPANVHPALRFAEPKVIELDNALSHLATVLQRLLAGVCGALVRLGAPRTPQARANVEAKFKLQAQRVVHQMPSTTGSHPKDPVRKRSEVPVDQRVRVDELEHVLDVYIANENATPAAGAGYEAPLERLRRQLLAGAIKIHYLPVARRKAHFFNGMRPVRLKVDFKNKRRPFINFLGSRYSSPQLQRAYSLTGKQMWVRFDPRDLRTLIVFLDDGTEFGPITALGQWGKFKHDLRIRKLFLRLKRDNELGEHPEDAPLEALFAHLRSGAPRDRTKALQLAHLLSSLGQALEASGRVQQMAEDERQTRATLEQFDSVALLTPEEMPDLPPIRRETAGKDLAPMSERVLVLPRRIQRR